MDELRRMLEREGGHDTLLQFLEVCPRIYSVVRYEAGEPAPGIGRVKTAVLAQKGYIGYPAVLFVYADGMGMDWEKIAITLHRGESDYREPTEKELEILEWLRKDATHFLILKKYVRLIEEE